MALREFKIEFNGYWREENKAALPCESGIYCVYACSFNAILKEVSISKLIYVGAAENVNEKIANHEKLGEWKGYLNYGEQLCYSFGAVERADRARCDGCHHFYPSATRQQRLSRPVSVRANHPIFDGTHSWIEERLFSRLN